MDFQNILFYAIIVIAIVIGLVLVNYISKYLIKKIENLMQNNEANNFLDSTAILSWVKDEIITGVVKSLNETVVKDVKNAAEDGKITEDEGQVILDHAINTIKSQLNDKVQQKLSFIVGDLDSWLESTIEVVLKDVKDGQR